MTPREQAQQGLAALKQSILGYLATKPEGVRSSEIARDLGLESDFEGNQKNYLSWSVLGLLVNEQKIRYETIGRAKLYFIY